MEFTILVIILILLLLLALSSDFLEFLFLSIIGLSIFLFIFGEPEIESTENGPVNIAIFSSENLLVRNSLRDFTEVPHKFHRLSEDSDLSNYDIVVTEIHNVKKYLNKDIVHFPYTSLSSSILKALPEQAWQPVSCFNSKYTYPVMGLVVNTGNSMCSDVMMGHNEIYISFMFDTLELSSDISKDFYDFSNSTHNHIALPTTTTVNQNVETVVKDFYSTKSLWSKQ